MYDQLLKQNKLFLTSDPVQEMLARAFQRDTDTDIANDQDDIIGTCRATKNTHFQWLARLIENHYEGIMAYASENASGIIEKTTNKIKRIRN